MRFSIRHGSRLQARRKVLDQITTKSMPLKAQSRPGPVLKHGVNWLRAFEKLAVQSRLNATKGVKINAS